MNLCPLMPTDLITYLFVPYEFVLTAVVRKSDSSSGHELFPRQSFLLRLCRVRRLMYIQDIDN